MKHQTPELARAIARSLKTMSDADLARYVQLVSTITACARFYNQARHARHAGCISAAQELEICAADALNRYVASAVTITTEGSDL